MPSQDLERSQNPLRSVPPAGFRHRMTISILMTAPLLFSTSAFAAPTQPDTSTTEPAAAGVDVKKKAKEHFETGLKLYEDSDYALALIEFERAYSYVPDFRVLYNIGQVSIQLGRYARASQALQQYLKNGATKIPADRANSVRNDLKMLEGRTAHLMVKSNVEGADVLLDDTILAKTPIEEPLLVDAGEHRVSVQKQGFVTHTEPLVLAGRDESTLQIDLAEQPQNTPIPDRPVVMQLPQPERQFPLGPTAPPPRKNELIYVGWGATGLFAVGWAVTGYIGIKAASDLHSALQRTTTTGELDSLKVKASSWLLASDILGVAAIATGGTTLYFTLKRPSQDSPTRHAGMTHLNMGLGPGSVQFTGAFD